MVLGAAGEGFEASHTPDLYCDFGRQGNASRHLNAYVGACVCCRHKRYERNLVNQKRRVMRMTGGCLRNDSCAPTTYNHRNCSYLSTPIGTPSTAVDLGS